MNKMMLLNVLSPLAVLAVLKSDVVIPETNIKVGYVKIVIAVVVLLLAVAGFVYELKNDKK